MSRPTGRLANVLDLRLRLRGAHWRMTEFWTRPSPSAILFSLLRHEWDVIVHRLIVMNLEYPAQSFLYNPLASINEFQNVVYISTRSWAMPLVGANAYSVTFTCANGERRDISELGSGNADPDPIHPRKSASHWLPTSIIVSLWLGWPSPAFYPLSVLWSQIMRAIRGGWHQSFYRYTLVSTSGYDS